MNEPVLIVGVKNIAQTIGLDHRTLRKIHLGNTDFPARKKDGRWITTRARLISWAESYLDQPEVSSQ